MKPPALFVLASLCAAAGPLSAQESYAIKLKELGDGESVLVTKAETTTTKFTVADGKGNTLREKREVKTEIQEYKETILKRTAGKSPAKLERDYTKQEIRKNNKSSDGPLHGKTVIIEKKGEKYAFTLKDGTALTGAAAEALDRDFSRKNDGKSEFKRMVLPKDPIKVGESWKIDMAKIVAELAKQGDMEIDTAKAIGQGTLVKAYKKEGRQFGAMTFKLEMPVITLGKDKNLLKFAAGAKIVLDLSLDGCIDGSTDAEGMKMKMQMIGTAPIPQTPGTTVTLDENREAAQVQVEVAKK